jgi:hypothetical protein
VKVVRLGSKEFVVGLEWVPLPVGASEARALKAHFVASQSKGTRFGVILEGPPITVGLAPVGSKKPSRPSAAALLALANRRRQEEADEKYTLEQANWIIIEPTGGLGDEAFWFVILKEGTPLPGSDILGNRETVLQELSDILELSSEFTVISSDAEVLRQAGSSARTSDEPIDALLSDGKEGPAKLKRLSGHGTLWIAALIFMVLVGSAWWAYSSYEKKQAALRAAQAAASAQQASQAKVEFDKKNYQATLQAASIEALKAGVKEIEDNLGGPSSGDVIAGWQSLIEGVNLYQSGWNLTDVSCSRETPIDLTCKVNLSRGELGVNRVLAEDRPDVQFDGENASYILKSGGLKTHSASWMDPLTIVSTRDFMLQMLSDLQANRGAGITHSVEESKEIVKDLVVPPPPASIFKPGNADAQHPANVQIQMGVATGKITLHGNDLWQIAGIIGTINRPNVVVQTLNVNLGGGSTSWVMVLDYYVRSKPQPVMPMISTTDGPITISLPPEYAAKVAEENTGKLSSSSVKATDIQTKDNDAQKSKTLPGAQVLAPPPEAFNEDAKKGP